MREKKKTLGVQRSGNDTVETVSSATNPVIPVRLPIEGNSDKPKAKRTSARGKKKEKKGKKIVVPFCTALKIRLLHSLPPLATPARRDMNRPLYRYFKTVCNLNLRIDRPYMMSFPSIMDAK